ncbi:MAG: tetratricopeptide repeat protein [Chloroflexota bacterium]
MIDFPHKIVVPQYPQHIVLRSRLNSLLQNITEKRLITLSAPAGYGKTSLLTAFAHMATLRVCWYTLDPSDQNPWAFLDYLVASIEQQFPETTTQTRSLLQGASQASFQRVVDALTNDIYALDEDFIIVLDDWHLVDHVNEISAVITHLLLRCMHCRVILASRSYPSLPDMMLLAARRQMHSLNESHLRFTAEEVNEVIKVGYDTELSDDQIAMLTEQFNGWIAGILLSFQASDNMASAFAPLGMSAERQIYHFLAEQVFEQQGTEVREFLLESSLLEELSREHCNTMLARSDSQSMLEILYRRHLFISEIRTGVLRYHPIFREFLQEHFANVNLAHYYTIAESVADAYAEQGQWLLAFERYITIGKRESALKVIAAGGEHLYRTGRLETLEHWFSKVSVELLDAQLLCLKARVLIKRGNHLEAQTLTKIAETRMQPDDEPVVLLLQAQIARTIGQYTQALDIAQRVHDMTQDVGQQSAAMRTIAICHHRLGQLESAINYFKEALAIEQRRGDLYAMAQLQRDLGICYKELGQLSLAEEYYTQADTYWNMIGNTGLRALSLNSKGSAQHLIGHYQDAHTTLISALEFAREAAVPDYTATVLSSIGDLYNDLQLWDRASFAYDEARRTGGSAYILHYLDIESIRLVLRQKNYEAAARALRHLSETTIRHHTTSVLLLQGKTAYGLKQYEKAARYAREVIDRRNQDVSLIDLARAYLLQAQITADTQPFETCNVVEALDQAAQITKQLGHSAFVIVETIGMRSTLRRAGSNGWSLAHEWLQRQQDLFMVSKLLEEDNQLPVLVMRTLGSDQITLDGQTVELGWQKAREVFYYLLAHPDGAPIDTLREAIWPDLPVDRSRDALRSAIYQLRSTLPRELIELQGRRIYRLNRSVVRIDYDAEQFLAILDQGASDPEKLSQAIDLYSGDYLPFADNTWCVSLRTYLAGRYRYALHQAATAYEQAQLLLDALMLYQDILTLDEFDESAHAGIMRCQIALGNRNAAITQYQTLRRLLDEELGLELERTSEVEHLYRELLETS